MKCKLTKETFIAYTVEINVKEYDYSKTIVLYDLLGQINSFLQQIIEQKLNSLIELNRNFILDIFVIL